MPSKSKGRPAKTLSDKDKKLAGYMYLNGRTREQIAEYFDVSVPTVRKLIGKDLDEVKNELDAEVAGYLFSAIKKGCITSTIFYLKCKAQWKDKQPELDQKAPPTININLSDKTKKNES